MTLPNVEVVCTGLFSPGQLAVALGRAVTTSGLAVIGFDKMRHTIAPLPSVIQFLNSTDTPVAPNMQCCMHHAPLKDIQNMDIDSDDDWDDTDLFNICNLNSLLESDESDDNMEADYDDEVEDDDQNDSDDDQDDDGDDDDQDDDGNDNDEPKSAFKCSVRVEAKAKVASERPNMSELEDLVDSLIVPDDLCFTPNQKEFNQVLLLLKLDDDFIPFVFYIWNYLDVFWEESVTQGVGVNIVQGKCLTSFYQKCHIFSCSTHLSENVPELLVVPHFKLSVFCAVRKLFILKRKSEVCSERSYDNVNKGASLSDAGMAKIRNLAGRTIHKCKNNMSSLIEKKVRSKTIDVELYRDKLDHLHHACTSFEHVAKGRYVASLEEVERRQNSNRGLTHVTDETFEFFMCLETKRIALHSVNMARQHKSNTLSISFKELKRDVELYMKFRAIFSDFNSSDKNAIKSLFEDILQGYMIVANNQFRKTLMLALEKKKKLRHRASVQNTGSVTKGKKEKSNGKENKCKKQICRASTSKVEEKVKCPVCNIVWPKGQKAWIECGGLCKDWYHRNCAGLKILRQWKKFNNTDADWFCNNCLKP